MATKHTPGPWVWLGEPGRSELNAAHGMVLDYAGYEGMYPGAYDQKAGTDAANMALIAASPDMHLALSEVVEAFDLGCVDSATIKMARAALAKASAE